MRTKNDFEKNFNCGGTSYFPISNVASHKIWIWGNKDFPCHLSLFQFPCFSKCNRFEEAFRYWTFVFQTKTILRTRGLKNWCDGLNIIIQPVSHSVQNFFVTSMLRLAFHLDIGNIISKHSTSRFIFPQYCISWTPKNM